MIPVVKEANKDFTFFNIYEHCYFCSKETSTWHLRTNQPVCTECAKVHKVSEVPICTPGLKYIPKSRKKA